jgi:Holliday junction resolvase RusA-like endonuclease
MSFEITLPLPPSTNALYVQVSKKKRIKTKAHNTWRHAAIQSIWAQVRADRGVWGPVALSMCVPSGMRGDLDNRIKATIDALVASGRIDDDKHVSSITIQRGGAAAGTITILVKAVGA